MSPPVITWFFNPALALWPAPHDEVKTTCGIKGAIVRILNGHPLRAGGSRTAPTSRPLRFANGDWDCPSGLQGGASINTPHPNTTATSSLVTRFVVALRLTSIKHVTGTVAVRPGAFAFTFRLGQSLLARHVDSRPQTLVYKLVIAASKKVVAHSPVRRGDVSGRLCADCVVGLGACYYLYNRCGMKVKWPRRPTGEGV